MTKHRLMKDEDDFADSVAVDDASWRDFMDAGGVYPKEVDPPTMPAALDEITFIKATEAETEFNNAVFNSNALLDNVIPDGFDDVRTRDL
jgi:hypothetical protein